MIHAKDFVPVVTIAPAAIRTATVTGAAVELKQQAAGPVPIVFNVGVITDGTHTPSIEDSPDNSAWTAVTELDGTLAALASGVLQIVGYKGAARYVRAKVTVTGSPGTGGYYDAVVLQKPAKI